MKRDKEKDTSVVTKVAADLLEIPVAEVQAAMPADTPEQYVDTHGVTTIQDRPRRYGMTHRFNCLEKLKPHEPFFVLRAQDITAHVYVEQWAMQAERRGVDPAKVAAARNIALEMQAWKERKYPD